MEDKLKFITAIGLNQTQHLHKNFSNLGHPESPSRIEVIVEELIRQKLLEKCQVLQDFGYCDKEDLLFVHSVKHVESVYNTRAKGQRYIDEWARTYDSVFATPIPNGFALVRPPGHHADKETASGFCLFNNVAQAADSALLHGADRVLIVDLDVHPGHGTQRIFYDDDRVLHFSIHRHEFGRFWPYLAESGASFVGEGTGKGYNVNIPLQETGCGDADYLCILFQVLLPLARSFQPDVVLVSAGFDALAGDPVGGMDVSPALYAHFIYHLQMLASGRILLVLEGGYNHKLGAIAGSYCVRVLLGEHPPKLHLRMQRPKASTTESILNSIAYIRPFWSVFNFYAVIGWKHVKEDLVYPAGDQRRAIYNNNNK